MASDKARVIFFTGAPRPGSLDWQEQHLISVLIPAFRQYLGEEPYAAPAPDLPSSTSGLPSWRSMPLHRERLHPPPYGAFHLRDTEPAQAYYHGDEAPPFLSIHAAPDAEADRCATQTQFLEQSFALHEDLPCSQLTPSQPEDTTEITLTSIPPASTAGDATSFPSADASTLGASAPDARPPPRELSIPTHLTCLSRLPTPSHLHSIAPQTMTVHLLVGIISTTAARTVRLRRPHPHARTMDVVELLVGDDTAAGFGVSFWLAPADAQPPAADHASTRRGLDALRRGDVVLLRDVALGVFGGRVYGQSLRRRVGRIETRVEVMVPAGEDAVGGLRVAGAGGRGVQLERLERVREWAGRFVGVGGGGAVGGRKRKGGGGVERGRNAKRRVVDEEELPPDTP